MSLKIRIIHVADPDGHNPALLLRGDWLIIEISDGHYCGYGEASHSRDDTDCEKTILQLFDTYIKDIDLDLQAIEMLSVGVFFQASSFISATAISGINQALYDLLAKREQRSVWGLFSDKMEISPHNPSGPVASLASLHASVIASNVTSIEIPLIIDEKKAYYLEWLDKGTLNIPDGPGWGGKLEILAS